MTDKWQSRLDGIESEMEAQRREIEAYNRYILGVKLASLAIMALAIAALFWGAIQ